MIALGIDVGGTHTKLGLVNQVGNLISSSRIDTKTEGDPTPYLEELLTEVDQLAKAAPEPLIGIGLSVHGFVDADRRGPIICPNTPGLRGVDIRGLFEKRFQMPITLDTDLTAHTLAEYHFGSGRGTKRFLCMAIGTGLGAGVVIEGQALRYLGGCAGDTGHIILEPGGPRCSQGCAGCAEALCGVAGVERLALERIGRPLRAHEVITGARNGDPECVQVIDQIGVWLGQTLASLCSIFLPEKVALSGGISEAGPVLLEACKTRFNALVGDYHAEAIRSGEGFYRGVEFVISTLRGQTGIVGAVAELIKNQD